MAQNRPKRNLSYTVGFSITDEKSLYGWADDVALVWKILQYEFCHVFQHWIKRSVRALEVVHDLLSPICWSPLLFQQFSKLPRILAKLKPFQVYFRKKKIKWWWKSLSWFATFTSGSARDPSCNGFHSFDLIPLLRRQLLHFLSNPLLNWGLVTLERWPSQPVMKKYKCRSFFAVR